MALAIASGMPPQTGLYTAMVAGFIAALCGGSRAQVTGPTAAFVVILAPVVSAYGPGGLLLATLLAGVMLLLLGVFRLGRLVEFIPYPVTAGFTVGIAITIAVIQLQDFFGLTFAHTPESNIDRFREIAGSWSSFTSGDTLVGLFTLLALLVWGKLQWARKIPGAIVVLPLAIVLAMVLNNVGPQWQVQTIDSTFGRVVNGVSQGGIPTGLPAFEAPWHRVIHIGPVDPQDPSEGLFGISTGELEGIIRAAVAIAILGAIESLLSAVIADSMTGRKHHPDGELVGQGIANIAAPWFGGFAATGALARTAANIRAGATSPVAAVVHAAFIGLALLWFGPVLGWLPMASLAGLLIVVAKNMADLRHCVFVVKMAPRSDGLVLVVCALLTVGMDMVVAVSVGVVLAAFIFMRRMAELSGVDLGDTNGAEQFETPPGVLYYRIRGPLFFGAAQKAMQEVRTEGWAKCAVIDLSHVPLIDATGIVNLESAVDRLWRAGIPVIIAGANESVAASVKQARFPWEEEGASFVHSVEEALMVAAETCKRR